MYKYYASTSFQGPYEIGIVASQNNTVVQIELARPLPHPAVALNYNGKSYSSGDIIEVTLQAYETLQVNIICILHK